MCHQSVGLVQGAIEAVGMPSISISVRPEITVNMRVSRAAYLRFPTGNPVGQPHMPNQQRTILRGVLRALMEIDTPGTVVELPYRWRRMPDVDEDAPPPPTEAKPDQPDEDLHAAARRHVEDIQATYEALMEAVDRYRRWLEATIAAERAKPLPDAVKLQAFLPQLRYLDELQAALETSAHDGLVRVSDRVVRIRHWEDGTFI
jgi:D-proline reductase (dithiol) PrdB